MRGGTPLAMPPPKMLMLKLVSGAVGLAVVTVAVAWTLSDPKALVFFAVLLGFTAGVYVGFGLADGRARERRIELIVGLVFLLVAAFGLWTSALVIGLGFFVHGIWDLLHHPRRIATMVSSWFPPFCALYDLLVAAYIVARWMELG